MSTQDAERLRAGLDADERYLRAMIGICERKAEQQPEGVPVAEFAEMLGRALSVLNTPEAREVHRLWKESGSGRPPTVLRRMLDEVTAKRHILALCETETDETGGKPLAVRIIAALAAVYQDVSAGTG